MVGWIMGGGQMRGGSEDGRQRQLGVLVGLGLTTDWSPGEKTRSLRGLGSLVRPRTSSIEWEEEVEGFEPAHVKRQMPNAQVLLLVLLLPLTVKHKHNGWRSNLLTFQSCLPRE